MNEAARRGTLYLVPTPIGNEDDLSPRAIQVLARVAIVAAEDTRVTARLLSALGLRKRLVSYHDHNEAQRAPWLVEQLLRGGDVALISDAGTPEISDPGFRLVTLAVEQGIPITSIPGPSAAITALVASGLPTDRFTFAGFLPRRPQQRLAAVRELRGERGTLILFEAPHRVLDTLASLIEGLGDRRAAIGWNLTKPNERYLYGTLSKLRAELLSWEYVHGEFTLVVAGARDGDDEETWQRAEQSMRLLLSHAVPPRVVAAVVAALTQLPRGAAYQRVIELVRQSEAGGRPPS